VCYFKKPSVIKIYIVELFGERWLINYKEFRKKQSFRKRRAKRTYSKLFPRQHWVFLLELEISIVAYISVDKRWHCKRRPLLGNVRKMHATIEELCFLCGPCRYVITRSVWGNSFVVGYSPDSNDVIIEAEESPLLKSITGQRLVKQNEKT
jgi:hypothetical protein